jgi:hypothetical protein
MIVSQLLPKISGGNSTLPPERSCHHRARPYPFHLADEMRGIGAKILFRHLASPSRKSSPASICRMLLQSHFPTDPRETAWYSVAGDTNENRPMLIRASDD